MPDKKVSALPATTTPASTDVIPIYSVGTGDPLNKVTLANAISAVTAINAANIADGSVSNAEFQRLDGVTSALQTQLDSKQATGNYVTALTGDVTASGPGSSVATLASVISAGGPIGSATVVPIVTYDAKGRLITVSSATIAPPFSAITGTPTTLAGYGITNGQLGPLTGDVTTSSAAATLKNTGTAGTYRSVTFDAQGRETSGTNPTTFSGYAISDTSANLRAALTDENGTGVALFDGATTPSFTTGIQIGGAATSRKILVGNGTNFIQSTETWAVPGTSGNVLTSDGTNWTSAAPAAAAAGSLTGGTLAAGVTASSLTSLGTITTLNATTINAHTLGGTISGGGNQVNNIIIGTTTPLAGSFTAVTGTSFRLASLAESSTAPTIASGFGSSPSIVASNGTMAFTVNVGTGGTASDGTITLPAAATGWICHVENITALNANRASQRTVQVGTATSTTTVVVQNQSLATGVALAWAANDVLTFQCTAY